MTGISGIAEEIERKYLLSSLPPNITNAPHYRIIHGWIPGEIIQERITWNNRGDGEYWRVIKTGKGLVRTEIQEKIDKELWAKLSELCEKKFIEKTRYYITEDSLIWEIDEFHNRHQGLFLAEIEIPSADFEVKIPSWLQDYIIKEVTEDPSYLNINLVKKSEEQ